MLLYFKHSYFFLFGLLLIGCKGNAPVNKVEIIPNDVDSSNNINVDTTFEKGVICAIEDFNGSFEIPFYRTSKCEIVIDSIYLISHYDKDPEFMLKNEDDKLILPPRPDYFHYFDTDSRKSALIFQNEQNKAFQVLTIKDTLDGYWIKINDFPRAFKQFSWKVFLDTIPNYENLYINTVNRWIKLSSDTSYTNTIDDIDDARQHYAHISNHKGIHFELQAQVVDKWTFGGNENFNVVPVIRDASKIGWAKAILNGHPQIEFTRTPHHKSNFYHGVGHIKGNHSPQYGNSNHATQDSLYLFDKPNGERVGSIPLLSSELYIEFATLDKDTNRQRQTFQGYDLNFGMISWNYIRVYEKEDNWVHILGDQFEDQATWINLNDLDDSLYTYYSWVKYYKHFPNGNDAWQKGYSWCGDTGALYTKPDMPSEIILKFPFNCSIYLLGPIEGNMAKVKVQELKHLFGAEEDGYSGKDKIYREWVGWIELVDAYGYANLDEIILGC